MQFFQNVNVKIVFKLLAPVWVAILMLIKCFYITHYYVVTGVHVFECGLSELRAVLDHIVYLTNLAQRLRSKMCPITQL